METQLNPYHLERFVEAQEPIYTTALAELRNGQKRTHWMWYIFPQIEGLGFSVTSKYYALKNLDEARRYLAHPILGERLRECCNALLRVQGRTAYQIFGSPDDLKLKSCMTLFSEAAEEPEVFTEVLEEYFKGQKDQRTLDILAELKEQLR